MQLHGWQWVIVFTAACQLAAAQDPNPATATNPATAPEDAPPVAEQRVYLPYRALRTVFEKHGAAVFMPFQEYLKLWEQTLGRGLRPAEGPPVGGVITSAQYAAIAEKDLVRIQAEFDVQVLQSGWVELPVRFGQAAIGSVSAEPGPVLLRGTGEGEYALLFSQSGRHKVRMELSTRVITAPEGRSFDLQIPTVGITTFQLTVPDADQTIELQPKLLQQAAPSEPNTTRINASLGSTGQVTARWHPRVGTRPDMELLASATSATAVSVEDGLLHADAYFTVEVLRGQLERLRVAVPTGHRILDVASSAGVKEWTVAEEAGRQVITVELLSRQGGKIPLEVHTERPVQAEPFDVAGLEGEVAHGLHLLDVLRESGQLALKAGVDLTLNVTTQQGLARIDEAEVDPRIKRPGASFFKFYTPQCRLTATVKPVEPRLLVNHLAEITIETDRIKLDSTLTYTIERAGVFELRFSVPEGLTIENVTCESFKHFDVSADGRTLTVSLREGKLGSLAVRVQGIRKRGEVAAASEEFVAPLLEPQGVEVETGQLWILAPESLEIITDSAQITGFQPDRGDAVSPQAPLRLVSAWTFHRRPVNLSGKIVAKPTRLTANVATQLEVKSGQVQVDARLDYLVEYAGLDVFRFAVPEGVADRVQISLADGDAAPIREKSRGEVEDGWVTWTVVLQREVTGAVRLKVLYDLPTTTEANAAAETATVALPRIVDPYDAAEDDPRRRSISVARVTGEVTARKDRALSVTATATGGDVETIDVRELTGLPQDGFVAFRYYKQPVEAQLSASKFDIQAVMKTVVSRGLVEVVLDRTGQAMFRCRYQVKTSERQRLQIDLPQEIEPLGVFVDRKSIALEKNTDAKAPDGWDSYYVNVARTKSSDEPFLLSVQYRLRYTRPPFQSRAGKLEWLRFPLIGGSNEGTAPIQQFRVQVWTPDEFALVGTPRNFETEHEPRLRELLLTGGPVAVGDNYQQWIGDDAPGVFDFPTEGHSYRYTNLGGRDRMALTWWHLPFFTWIVSGALVLIAIVLRNTTWENKLTLLILAAFLAAVVATQDADLVLHSLAVASYGLVALVGLWVVHGLLRRSKKGRYQGPPPATPPAAVIPPPGVFDSVTLGLQKPS